MTDGKLTLENPHPSCFSMAGLFASQQTQAAGQKARCKKGKI
jgi:hypothetical protein